MTKGGKRHGAAESAVLGFEPVVKVLRLWKTLASPETHVTPSPPRWQALFNRCLEELGIQESSGALDRTRSGGAGRRFGSRNTRT